MTNVLWHCNGGKDKFCSDGEAIELVRRTDEPTMILHDTEDGEIPFQHSLSLAQAAPHARFHTTRSWGPYRLLGSPAVIEQVVRFVSQKSGDLRSENVTLVAILKENSYEN